VSDPPDEHAASTTTSPATAIPNLRISRPPERRPPTLDGRAGPVGVSARDHDARRRARPPRRP
jgi:hypothetical protein